VICAIDVVVLQGALPGIAPVEPSPAALAERPPAPNRLVPDMLVTGMLVPGTPVAGRMGAASGTAPSAAQSAAKQSAADIAALVTEIATAQKIDPLLVLAIIATESAFRTDAISPGNAQGLMQLMPETARRFGARNLLDPAENIAAGTRYLRWLLAYFEGDLSLALAGYNAGEGAVLRHGGIPPYPETRLYLQRIRLLYPAERHPFDQLALR
jgi:soluble lytic murein transglycosylase-like protein